ncbi:isoprenylcysteine carboxyl methyltransferase family protein, partial [Heyndrickxia sporothermodurans]|uniref:isoprenylcysteine carboxyl methyltransferase family protein n=1 Tax=Heyndrickxia sporothermodurans TaxID=46224 RepID=UPI000D37DA1F
MFFYLLLVIIIIQRCVELFIAKKNERFLKDQGAKEYGRKHYLFMVMMHICFFVSLLVEVTFFAKSLSSLWPIWFSLFLLTQIGRVWVIQSLGTFWNTKIIVLPEATIVSKGPYKYIKHPNYLIVTTELLVIPLMFNAYFTLVCFFILNQLILACLFYTYSSTREG